jgi:hypothetical protein
MLNSMRIGTLPEKDRISTDIDPYANDPQRDVAITARSTTPFNGESPTSTMTSYITPNELHFKRNHLPVPLVLPEAYELQVCAPLVSCEAAAVPFSRAAVLCNAERTGHGGACRGEGFLSESCCALEEMYLMNP